VFHYEGGLMEYVQHMNRDNDMLHDEPISLIRDVDGVHVEVALQWSANTYSDTVLGYANSIRTVDGGTHIDGLKTALTRTVNSLARKHKLLKDADSNFNGEHVREGLSCIVAVKVPNPEFEGQTKTRLGNPEVRKAVDTVVAEELTEALGFRLDVLGAIAKKAAAAARVRDDVVHCHVRTNQPFQNPEESSIVRSSSACGCVLPVSTYTPYPCKVYVRPLS